jgi:ribosomal protein S18 acetylase RimI-like enzyme
MSAGDITYRPATLADAADIHELLLSLAPEIPLLADTLEREEALYALVRTCARSGESWVALNADGRIVGFVLAELIERGRHYAEHEVIDVRYAAVSAEYRNAGVSDALIAHLLARMVPVVTTVSPQNRTGLAAQLAAAGFQPVGASGEQRLRWEPGGS